MNKGGTRLEAMVGFLAGKVADARLLDDLADPSSEASRFLEATRARSRALMEPITVGRAAGRPGHGGSKILRYLGLTIAVSAALVGFGLVEARLRALEATLARGEAGALASARRLEAALGRLADAKPPTAPLAPIEAALVALDRRLDALDRKPEPPKADPTLAEVREQLEALRRELAAVEKGGARSSEELRASTHEVARLLRLLLGRSEPPAPATEPSPPVKATRRVP